MKISRPQTQDPRAEQMCRTTQTRMKPKQIFKFGNYNLGRIIGQGASAVVRAVTHLTTKQEFAIKIYEKSKL